MNLTHYKPLGNLMNMQEQMGRFFEDEFFNDFGLGRTTRSLSNWNPSTDVYETKDNYVFKLEVPGMDKDDVKIEFHNNTLTIKGERKKEEEVKDENYHRIERFSGSFSRSFTLPGEADAGKINASMKNGILELQIPKAEEKKARTIPINLN